MAGHSYMVREGTTCPPARCPSDNQGQRSESSKLIPLAPAGEPYTTMPPPHLLHHLTRVRW
jgi:hypothetical protein